MWRIERVVHCSLQLTPCDNSNRLKQTEARSNLTHCAGNPLERAQYPNYHCDLSGATELLHHHYLHLLRQKTCNHSCYSCKMVKFYENYFSYDFAWPAVTLAYFLRYPNPYSSHVLASDTLSRYLDSTSGKLTTVRLLLKRGKLPAAVARFLPKIKESYILERSVVDIRNQTMVTETRNLDWEGVISVVESQVYTPSSPSHNNLSDGEKTDVKLTVKISSRVGSNAREKVADAASSGGLWASWTTGSIQKSIEVIGMKRMREGLGRSKEGMKVVLEGLREKGLLAAMQERRERRLADQEEGVQTKWGNIWREAAGINGGDKLRKDSDE